MKNKLVLENITHVYGEGTPFEQTALKEVSLSIEEGKITGIIGHTGSGKSTMMQLLNGLTKPTSGRVLLDGYDINSRTEDVFEEWRSFPTYASMKPRAAKKAIKAEIERRRRELCFRVGLVMQYPEYQLFEETVFRDIAFGPTNMGLSEEEINLRVWEAAKLCGVADEWLPKSPFELSGGQKRRVAVAGVMAMRPEILVLDEPAAGLDPLGRSQIFEQILAYREQTGATVLIVSHSMEDMAQYCDNVVVLSDARVILQGEREEVFAHTELLRKVGLDIPQITRLVGILREKGIEIPENIYTVDRAFEILKEYFAKVSEGNKR
jgi:energy-coupling factor transport system ATP-binding protein